MKKLAEFNWFNFTMILKKSKNEQKFIYEDFTKIQVLIKSIDWFNDCIKT